MRARAPRYAPQPKALPTRTARHNTKTPRRLRAVAHVSVRAYALLSRCLAADAAHRKGQLPEIEIDLFKGQSTKSKICAQHQTRLGHRSAKARQQARPGAWRGAKETPIHGCGSNGGPGLHARYGGGGCSRALHNRQGRIGVPSDLGIGLTAQNQAVATPCLPSERVVQPADTAFKRTTDGSAAAGDNTVYCRVEIIDDARKQRASIGHEHAHARFALTL